MALRVIDRLMSHGNRPAVRGAGSNAADLTYGELARRVDGLVTRLRGALPGGAAVLLCYPNRADYLCAFLAVLAAEDSLFPVPRESTAPELARAVEHCSAAAAIISRDLLPSIGNLFHAMCPLPELAEDAVLLTGSPWPSARGSGSGLLLQSSGTTGEPKIVRRDGSSLDAVAANMVRACGFRPDDRVLAAVPLCHSYGLEHGILAPVWAGSCVHVCDGFDLANVLPELRDGGITLLPGVPFMFELLCKTEGQSFLSLRRAYSAGGPLPTQVVGEFERKFGLRLGQLYGATEIGSVTFNDPNAPEFNPGNVGVPMAGVSIKILDVENPRLDEPLPSGVEGQVAIAAPSMLSGYVNGGSAPLLGGHFLTGDLGMLDECGALTITGRLKLLIDVGGRKVNPAEVEATLRRHTQVGQCVVVPIRLSDTVCRMKAVVTPARPDAELSAQDLRRFARQRLSAYKVPRVFEIRPSLPTSPAGKVLRHLVEAS